VRRAYPHGEFKKEGGIYSGESVTANVKNASKTPTNAIMRAVLSLLSV
jgi:hypothetical protein